MSTDAPQTQEAEAAAEIARREPLLRRLKPTVPDWRPAARRVAGAIAAVAAVGAVLSGLTGYWSTYKTVVGELFGHKPAVIASINGEVSPSPFDPPRLSIAVLPFTMLGGDPSQDYLAAAIVDNLTTDLSVHIAGLLVTAQGSAFTYKGRTIDAKQIGRDLGVRFLLQGSVQRSDNRVRVNAQLIETKAAAQLWAERFDGYGTEVLGIQDQITTRIANSLGAALTRANARDAETRTTNADAQDYIFRAQAADLFPTQSMNALNEAEEFYRKALAIDPLNAEAMTGVAKELILRSFLFGPGFNSSPRLSAEQMAAAIKEATALARRAVELRPQSALAHSVNGMAYSMVRRPREAMAELEAARSLDPNLAANYGAMAGIAILLGEPENAITFVNEFIRHSPRDPAIYWTDHHLCRANVLLGRWDESIQFGLKARMSFPSDNLLRNALAAAYAQKGQLAEAKVYVDEILANDPAASLARLRRNLASTEPAYAKLAEATIVDGLRKAGLPEGP